MSRASKRAGGSISAVAALALSAMGLAALPASATEDETTDVSTVQPTESPEAVEETPAAEDTPASEETSKDSNATNEGKEASTKITAQAASDPITLDIVAISDFHGHIENAPELDNIVKGIAASNPGYTGFVGNGDLVGGSAYVSAIAQDVPTMEILTAMDLQMSAAGNHEFDKSYRDFEDRIVDLSGYPYAAANVQGLDADSKIAPYIIETYGSGDKQVKVAYVGAVTDQLGTLVSPDGIKGLTIDNPVAAVDKQAGFLKDGDDSNGEADVVIAMIHETLGVSQGVGKDVDAVVAGHTHQEKMSTTASGAPAIETGQFGTSYGHITVTVDGDDVSATADVINVSSKLCEGDPAWSKYADEKDPTKIPAKVVNPTICPMYLAALENANELGKGPVGEIVGGADQGTNDEKQASLGTNRGTEMTGSNLIAQAFYEYSQGMAIKADFGIMNPGGVRASIDSNGDGVVTKGESFTAQPFGNDYATVDITGAQVYRMLEEQWADASTQTSRPMLALGLSDTISYTYDADAAFGSHIKHVYVNNKLVDPNGTDLYTVASNQFLLAGGDGFNVFKKGANYNSTGLIDNEVFNDFLAAASPHTVDYAQRSVAITGDDAITAGAGANIDLASLSMTYAGYLQPLPETVEVALVPLADAPLATHLLPDTQDWDSVAVDNTITANLNETGQATLELTVPKNYNAKKFAMVIVAGPTVFQIPGGLVTDLQAAPNPEPTETATVTPTTTPSTQPTSGATTQPGKDLPNTGANVAGYIVVALVLMTAGGVLVARRRTDQI